MAEANNSRGVLRSFFNRYRGIFVVLIVSVQLFIASGPVYAYNVLFLSFEDEFKAGAALTGVFVFAPLFRALTALYGWRNALRIIGGGYFLLSAACGVFLASPVTIESEAPEMGREGGSGEDIPPDAASKLVGGKGADEEETLQRRFVRALLQADLWLWLFGFMLSNVAWTFFLINYASFMEHDRSFTTDQITQALVLGAVGEILGKVVLSLLGDRLPCLKIYEVVATGVLAAVACGLVTVLHNVTTILIFSFVLGPVRSVSYASPYPSAMEIFGDYGSNLVTVILLIPIGIGSFLGGPVTGSIYDSMGDYTVALFIVASIFMCSSVCLIVIPVKKRLQSRRAARHRSTSSSTIPSAAKHDRVSAKELET
ncbi:monocarboxylate transporter 13-like isoform X3 [Acanthaster planci]|uniref:Monocarboxylate transporter 13-like isoform X3 n=1 Tax=Acanthaster planci TaxID=133434 RepID=A0A8B7ZG93_ACAPL|nr:monocarboxylate transporter 13-like isoform X3 [Acanthaster planci]